MATTDVLLALLSPGPKHGYDVKQGHDAWFPDGRPMAFGQVYAALARLAQDGLVEVAGTQVQGGPERTVYALTAAGAERLNAWLAEPAAAGAGTTDEIVRKAIAALRTGHDATGFLDRQRAAHLRRMHELQAATQANGGDAAARLARDHLIAHLDADLRWLEVAVERITAANAETTPTEEPAA
jgi:DNA-binding PadR family transcriptional regulator